MHQLLRKTLLSFETETGHVSRHTVYVVGDTEAAKATIWVWKEGPFVEIFSKTDFFTAFKKLEYETNQTNLLRLPTLADPNTQRVQDESYETFLNRVGGFDCLYPILDNCKSFM